LPQPIATRRSFQVPIAIAAGALIVLLIAREANQWRHFQWSAFWRYSANISIGSVLLAIAAIYAAYAIRAVRWRLLAGFHEGSTLGLFAPTIIGFTAVAVLGRAGELVRPWLISAREQVSFESQMLVWGVERLFDTAAALALIGTALLMNSKSLPYLQAFRIAGLILVAIVVAGASGVSLLARSTRRAAVWSSKYQNSRALRFVALRLQNTMRAAQALNSRKTLIMSGLLSLGMWLLIAAAYYATFHSFRAVQAHMSLLHILILMGFSLAGSLVPLPAAGGQQLAVVAALVAVFRFNSDLAVSCGILLWLATWISIVPLGLILLRSEGLNLWNLARKRGD
jgi:uncharacterized protein (TIRG00374 family)